MNPIIIFILLPFIVIIPAYASHGSSPIACEADGYEAGLDGPFSQKLYETCEEVGGADEYYNGFINGVCQQTIQKMFVSKQLCGMNIKVLELNEKGYPKFLDKSYSYRNHL